MKKRVAMTVLSILVSAFSVSVPVFAVPTERQTLAEFCELYGYRAAQYDYTEDVDYDIKPADTVTIPFEINDLISVSTTAANVHIYPDDFTISDAVMTFHDSSSSDEINDRNIAMCITGLSALEFNAVDDNIFSLNSRINGGSASALDEAFRILNEELIPSLNGDVIRRAKDNKEEVLLYSGNYDYYFTYYVPDSANGDMELYFLIARERK